MAWGQAPRRLGKSGAGNAPRLRESRERGASLRPGARSGRNFYKPGARKGKKHAEIEAGRRRFDRNAEARRTAESVENRGHFKRTKSKKAKRLDAGGALVGEPMGSREKSLQVGREKR